MENMFKLFRIPLGKSPKEYAKELLQKAQVYAQSVNSSEDVIDFSFYYGKLMEILDELIWLNEHRNVFMTPSPRKDKERIQGNIENTISDFFGRCFNRAFRIDDKMTKSNEIEHILKMLDNDTLFCSLLTERNKVEIDSYRNMVSVLRQQAIEESPALQRYEARQSEKFKSLMLITQDVMEKFDMIPYQLNCQIHYVRNNYAYMEFNEVNKKALFLAIDEINVFLQQSRSFSKDIPKNITIKKEKIRFDIPNKLNGLYEPISCIKCNPYTKNLNISKYPVTVIFCSTARREEGLIDANHGEIRYLVDGSIGFINLYCWRNKAVFFYKFRVMGRTLVIKNITMTKNQVSYLLYEI